MGLLLVLFYFSYLLMEPVTGDSCPQTIQPPQCACTPRTRNASTSMSICDEFNTTHITNKKKLGQIDISLPMCECGEYKIKLSINEMITNPTNCNINFIGEQPWKLHSNIQYIFYEPQQCISCQYNNISTVTFRYVFSGCYILEIVSTKYTLQASPIYITTHFKKEALKSNAVSIVPQFKENIQKIELKVNPINLLKLPSIQTTLMEAKCEIKCMRLEAITLVTSSSSSSNNYTESFTDSSTNTNVSWKCNYKKNSYTCILEKLEPGIYTIRFCFIDEYLCDSFKMNDSINDSFCESVSTLEVPKIVSIGSSYTVHKTDTKIIIICSIAGIILVAAIFLVPIYVHRRFYKSYTKLTTPTFNTTNCERLLPPVQEILTIYAQHSELFETMMESFQLLLKSVENTTVSDINIIDEVMLQQPENWTRKKILDAKVKIILFLNNRCIELYENTEAAYDINAKWQDKTIVYAIRQLQLLRPTNYTNLFVTHLRNITGRVAVFDDINLATRYIIPDNISELFRDIFPFQPNIDNDSLNHFNNLCQQCIDVEPSLSSVVSL